MTSCSPLVISVLLNFGRLSTFISVSMRTLDNKTLKKDVTNKQEKAVQLLAVCIFDFVHDVEVDNGTQAGGYLCFLSVKKKRTKLV